MHKRSKLKLKLAFASILVFAVAAYFYLPTIFGDMAYPLKYGDIIRREAEKDGVPAELVAGLILAESSFNERSTSGAGAMGLVQLMPGTAKAVAQRNGLPTSFNLYDPETSIKLGTLHIKELFDMYASLGPENQEKAMLIAYNAGSGVSDAWIRGGMQDKYLSRGVRGYVTRIQHYEDVYRQIYADELGLKKVEFQNAASTVNVEQKKTYTSSFWIDLFTRTINLKV